MSESQTTKPEAAGESGSHQLLKFIVELGPLVVFFLVNAQAGIFWGAGCFIVATLGARFGNQTS